MRPLLLVLAAAAFFALAAPVPIPQDPIPSGTPAFQGAPAQPRPLFSPDPPRHPRMAPNGRSSLHVDGHMTDVQQAPGPLGRDTRVSSAFQLGVCATVAFDPRGRIVSVCVGPLVPRLVLLDPATLDELAPAAALPPRRLSTRPFNDFTGGGYFYLDDAGRAVVPTGDRHLRTYRITGAPAFELVSDVDLTRVVAAGDGIVSVLPDWGGRIWFVSARGVVGYVERDGTVRSRGFGEAITNSFSVDAEGGVYVVTDAALYRLAANAGGIETVWREAYDNSGVAKPGQSGPGSGTTPTVMGSDLVAITDNADPMQVVVYRRAARVRGERKVCEEPVFARGASATDQSLIATRRSIVTENNFGYSGPLATSEGGRTAPGLARVDVDRDLRGCRTVWTSDEIAPSVVPKLSAATGLVYTYTKEPGAGDPWAFTALDFATGRTVFKRLAGEGLGFNNNFAPVTLADDGTAYVGALGGLVAVRDAVPPPAGLEPPAPRLTLRVSAVRPRRLRARQGGRARGARIRRLRARVGGPDAALVDRVTFRVGRARGARDLAPPYARTLRTRRPSRLRARVLMLDGRVLSLRARASRSGARG